MMNGRGQNDRQWSIILAGGEGERLRPAIHEWVGEHRPKQYCTFVGTRSLLQHTLDRADRISSPERRVTVIARRHAPEAWRHFTNRQPGTILVQPRNRDTAAGIFLPLTYIYARDPQATVIVYPSDHFVYPEEQFVRYVRRATWITEWMVDRLVVLAAVPDWAEPDYGWLKTGKVLGWAYGCRVLTVAQFIEKPSGIEASRALASGALWNTLVMATKAETLWELGWRSLPEVMEQFERLKEAIDTPREDAMLEDIYRTMPVRNFSRDLLSRVASHLALIEMTEVLWSDWGTAKRIRDSLSWIGKTPAFFREDVRSIAAEPTAPSPVAGPDEPPSRGQADERHAGL